MLKLDGGATGRGEPENLRGGSPYAAMVQQLRRNADWWDELAQRQHAPRAANASRAHARKARELADLLERKDIA